MNQESIAALNAAIGRVKASRSAAWEHLWNEANDGSRFDLTIPIDGAEASLSEIDNLITSLLEPLSKVATMEKAAFVPRSFLSRLTGSLNTVSDGFDRVVTTMSGKGFEVVSDTEMLTFLNSAGGSSNVLSPIRDIASALDASLADWLTIRSALRAPRFKDFNELFDVFTQARSELATLLSEVRSLRSRAIDASDRSKATLEAVTADQVETERLKNLATQDRQTVNEYVSDAKVRLEEIRSANTKAGEVAAQVDAYEEKFDQFDAALESRTKKFTQDSKAYETLLSDLNKQTDEINRLVADAEGMLKGATNAGLAGTFSAQQSKISKETGWAQFGFYISISVLLILSLPIAAYVLPKEFLTALLPEEVSNVIAVLGAGQKESDTQIISQVVARALLLIPGVWLVRFTSSRYERLFRLREDYAYKYSVASSVEGFKRQAPDYQGEIAAASFFELTFNPANSFAKSNASRHPNPIVERVMRLIEGKAEDVKG